MIAIADKPKVSAPSIHSVHADFVRRFGDLGPVFLAGGSVRDHLMGRDAKDFDVFVGAGFDGKTAHERCKDLEVVENLPTHAYEPFLRGTYKFNGVDVQVMSVGHKTADALLDTFDWNVCLFAFDGAIYQRTDVDAIGLGKPLVLQRVTYPRSTLRRGFRFSERFKMEFRQGDIVSLCRQVSEADRPSLLARIRSFVARRQRRKAGAK